MSNDPRSLSHGQVVLWLGAGVGLVLTFVLAPYLGAVAAALPIVGAIVAVAASVAFSKGPPPAMRTAQTSRSAAIEGAVGNPLLALLGAAFAFLLFAFLPALVLASNLPLSVGAGFAALVGVALFVLASRRQVTVGTDAVFARGMWSTHLLRHDEIARVEERASWAGFERMLRLHRRSGPPVDIAFRNDSTSQAPLVREWIEEARVAYARPEPISAFDRGAKPIEPWRSDIERLARRDVRYREAALDPEKASKLLAGADVPVDQRLGAALALRIADPAEAAEKIRVAAEATADPRLRDALSVIADEGDDAAIDDALRAAFLKD